MLDILSKPMFFFRELWVVQAFCALLLCIIHLGIVFDEDPRQGYVKDGIFHHPEMKFSFPVPNAWKVSNMPTEVRIAPEDQKGLVIFSTTEGTSPHDAMNRFAEGNGVTYSNTKDQKVNGMIAVDPKCFWM